MIKIDKLTSTDLPVSEIREELPSKTKILIKRIEVEKVQEFQFDSELDTPMSNNFASSQRSFAKSSSHKEKTPISTIGRPAYNLAFRSPKKFAKSMVFSNARPGVPMDPGNLLGTFVV